jgi:hypothetical protein
MAKPKIDKVKLSQLLRAGKTVKEAAKFFSVTPGRISQIKKELNINVVKSVALENAHRIVNKNLNTVDQLQKINQDANELLDLLMAWNRGDKQALQVLEGQVRKVRVGKTEKPVEEFKFKDPRELALRAMQEIRGQLKLQLEVFQTLYDLRAVQEFQEEVLTAIGEVDPDVRRRIVSKLHQKRALRAFITVDQRI